MNLFAFSRSSFRGHVLVALLAVGLLSPVAPAANLSITGNYGFTLGSTRIATPNGVVGMSGRRAQLVAPYVRAGAIQGGNISNVDSTYSNYLSVEFHRKAFVGATTGSLLYCRAYYGLAAGASYTGVATSGYFKSPDRDGFGAIVVFELGTTSTGSLFWTRRSTKFLSFAHF